MTAEPSTPLFNAMERLLSAVDRLDGSLKHVTVQQDRDIHQQQQLQVFERENQTLREERESLGASLKQLQQQYDDLQRVASSIYGKLDDAIRRISKVVDNNA